MNHTLRLAAFLAGILGFASEGAALSITSYADRASWEAAVGSFKLENFDSAPLAFGSEFCGPNVVPMNNSTVDVGDFSLTVDSQHNPCVGFYRTGTGNVYFLGDLHSPGFPGSQFEAMTFDRPINAFALDGGFSDGCGMSWCNGGAVAAIGNSFTVSIPFGSGFFGVITDYAFSDVRFTKTCCERAYHGLDNISYRFVPEPSTMGLLGLSLAGVVLTRRRRQ